VSSRHLTASAILFLFLSFPGVMLAESSRLGDYPSPQAMYDEIFALEAKSAGLVKVARYGTSVQGRPLLALHVGRSDGKRRPEALVAGNIHGNEYLGNRLAMSVARRLVEGDGGDPWITSLLDKIDFWIIPCINPDGYAKTWELQGNGESPVMRKNAHGVDLNRNFPKYGPVWLPIGWGGSNKSGNQYYHGPSVYSEPETQAIRDFTKQHNFFAAIDFHSWGGQFIPPKCPDHECVIAYKEMARAYRSKQPHVLYRRIQFRWLDQYTGEMEDMLYYEYGALAVCIELSTSKNNKPVYKTTHRQFWQSNPQNISYWIENDRDAALSAIEKALEITQKRPKKAVGCRP